MNDHSRTPPALRAAGSPPRVRRLGVLAISLLVLLSALSASAVELKKKDRQAIAALPAKYQEWVHEVEVILSEQELQAFLALEKDYQRDAFIQRFWRVRDPYPETARNEFRDNWNNLLEEAKDWFGSTDSEGARLLLLNGPPTARYLVDCSLLRPIQIFYYDGSEQVGFEFFLIFYRPTNNAPWRLWQPFDGLQKIAETSAASSPFGLTSIPPGVFFEQVQRQCRDGDAVAGSIAHVFYQGTSYDTVVARIWRERKGPDSEWVQTFNSYSTDLPDDAGTFPADFELSYPAHHQSRTVMQGLVEISPSDVGQADLAGNRSFNFVLTGEVLSGSELFENFRYKFDLPSSEVRADKIPLVFERYLRPGSYTLILKLEDLNSKKYFRKELPIEVPRVEKGRPPPPPADTASARLLAEANAAIANGETTIKLVPPQAKLLTGMVRFDTLTTGSDIDSVTFDMDGKPVLTKRRPPFSVELDLGTLPRTHELGVTAFDAAGDELADDSLEVNSGSQRFAVKLEEPRRGKTYHGSLRAEAKVSTPDDRPVDRVEFYLNEKRVATLYQAPWVQPIVLPDNEQLSYVRAVAYLPDGASTEDLVFVNAPDYLEEIDVQLVELYATVLDKGGHPVEGLKREDFTPIEDGVPQSIVRFEHVKDLPIHAGILLDISASMEDSLDDTRDAALKFLQEAIEPKDRAALMTFNDRPALAVKFTNDISELAGGLAGLKAERGTALYDSLIFALYYFNGIKGQRALLVLSDGKDENSRFSFEDTLEFARRAGVTLYTIALRDDVAHKKLSRLAEETGGRSFFVQDPSQLGPIYETIQRELRSQYLVVYQSNDTSKDNGFRSVELKVDKPGLEVKTIRGYYP